MIRKKTYHNGNRRIYVGQNGYYWGTVGDKTSTIVQSVYTSILGGIWGFVNKNKERRRGDALTAIALELIIVCQSITLNLTFRWK